MNIEKYDLIGIKGNNSKIFRDLNWEPKIQLKEISKIMIDYELKIRTYEIKIY